MCPDQGSDPASGHPGAQKPPLGRGPHRRYGVSTWMHLASGPPLCGPDTEQRNRDTLGAPLAPPTKGKEGQVGR